LRYEFLPVFFAPTGHIPSIFQKHIDAPLRLKILS
jgi:hypothetical protein